MVNLLVFDWAVCGPLSVYLLDDKTGITQTIHCEKEGVNSVAVYRDGDGPYLHDRLPTSQPPSLQ